MSVEKIYKILGLRIRSARIRLGLTQEELATRIGYRRTTVVNIEAGRQRVMMHSVARFAKILKTTPERLARGIWQ